MRLGLAALLMLAPGMATSQVLNCDNPQYQQEMNACAERDWQDADQVLNAVWAEARAMAKTLDADLPADMQGVWQALLDGQRAWVTYRDKSCEAEGGMMRGGSAEPLLVYSCMARLTWERVEGLQGFVEMGG